MLEICYILAGKLISMVSTQPYRLSFTAATLRIEDSGAHAQFMLAHPEPYSWHSVPDDLFGNMKQSTFRRLLRELNHRLTTLPRAGLVLLSEGTYSQRRNMCYLAVLKTYPFIRHFVERVIIWNHEVFKTQIEDWQYADFFRQEEMNYDELREVSDATLAKMKRNLFTILREAEIVSGKSELIITPVILGTEDSVVLSRGPKNWIPYFTLRKQ